MGNYISLPLPDATEAPAAPKAFDLFDVTVGVPCGPDKPRSATNVEVEAYLRDLARRRGIGLPRNAAFSCTGIHAGNDLILSMPGYGADAAVIMEELDEAGAVVRTSRIGVDRKGCIGLKAPAVRKACALPAVRKARKPAAEPVQASPAVPAPVEPEQAVPAAGDGTAAIAARLEALEAIVARLSRPVVAGKRQRSEAERRAILRAWRMRGEMRARADLDRRALLAVNDGNRILREQLERVQAERDAIREQAANARTAATAYKREGASIAISHGRAMNRADRLARIAVASRTARRRMADDLRGSRAEARALTRKLQDARTAAAPVMMLHRDSGAVAALSA